ncbi:helix-turn-helix domain-containing protein [Bacillus paramycoides]|uniref:helix-turn-helix domain-containing protein n=1 Tax=Bacillus paramycoides TaxID=2026194 RepID=UPI003CFD2D52
MRKFTYALIDEKVIERKIHILEALNNGQQLVTSQKLADQMRCSTRTIIKDISQLKHELPEDWEIIAVKTKGYILIKPMEDSILPVINSYLEKSALYKVVLGIFNNKHYTLEKWSQLLYMNKATLKNHLKSYTKVLNKNKLTIKFRNLQIEGDEMHLRYYYIAFFHFTQKFSDQYLFSIELRNKLASILYRYEVHLDTSILNSIIFVCINRFFNHHYLTKEIKFKPIYSHNQSNCINEIIVEIENYYKVKLPKLEKDVLNLFIFLVLVSTRSQGDVMLEYISECDHKKFMNLIDTLFTNNKLPSKSKGNLKAKVIPYFYKARILNELNLSIDYFSEPIDHFNIILFKNYMENMYLISSWNEIENDKQFTRDEITYIAAHVTPAINSSINEINILLVFSVITIEKEIIYKKLKLSLGENVKIDIIPNYNIKYDFIISNSQLPDTGAPVIYISQMLTRHEIDSIKNYIINLN